MKIFRKLKIYFLTAALVIASAGVFAPAASAAPDIELDCGAAILADMETGTVLYSKEADKRMYPASLTKIMTALVALDAFQNGQVTLNDRVTVSSTAFSDIPADGASLTPKLQEGEIMSLEDLLYCLIMTSANEPCNVVAEHVSGSVAEFVSDMNSMAQSLGCTGTHFTNTHGIHDTDQYSTAYDLMLIMRKAMSIPQFAKISGTYEYTVPATNLAGERSLRNTNDLLRESTASFYEYAKGGKTGYTNASGYCLASAAQKGEVYLVSVVLNTISVELPSGARQAKSFPETKKLYQWGFDNFSYRTVISTMNLVKEVPVALGNGAETVVLRPENSIVRLLDNDTEPTGGW